MVYGGYSSVVRGIVPLRGQNRVSLADVVCTNVLSARLSYVTVCWLAALVMNKAIEGAADVHLNA